MRPSSSTTFLLLFLVIFCISTSSFPFHSSSSSSSFSSLFVSANSTNATTGAGTTTNGTTITLVSTGGNGTTAMATTTTTTTTTPAPPPPTFPRFPVFTVRPRATSTTTTTGTTTTTLPPTTTLASDISATYVQVDVFFSTYFDQYLQDYLNLFSELSGVPLTRISVLEYQGFPSAVTGEGYVMSLQFLQPTSTDSADASIGPEAASTILEQALSSGVDDRIAERGITSATRVGTEKRVAEDNGKGVNWIWLILWLLTVFLVVLSIGALFRTRPAETVEDESSGSGSGSGGMHVPDDDTDKPREKLQELVERGEKRRVEKETQRREEIKFAPGPELFAATLEYENRIRLPPQGGIKSRRTRGGGRHGGGDEGDEEQMRSLNQFDDDEGEYEHEGDGSSGRGGEKIRDSATVEGKSTEEEHLVHEEKHNDNRKEPLENNPALDKVEQPLQQPELEEL